MSKIRIENIRNEIEKDGWKLISDTYKNLESELVFECPKGHKIYISWGKLRQKKECPICKNKQKLDFTKNIRILSLDQSTKITGYAIFENENLIQSGIIKVKDTNEIARLSEMKKKIIDLINSYKPNLIVIEDIQLQSEFGVTTYKALAHLQGIILEYCFSNHINYKIISSAIWRAHCKIRGKNRQDKKKEMQQLIKNKYNINVSDDEADAIGIGLATIEINKKEIKSWE